jgi:glycosyltransferase involved in cell wall biosynthesis
LGPRVAIIVPCFNDVDLAEEAIASVKEGEPVEMVVVDDGSTLPAARERLDGLADRGVRVIRASVNGGLAAARMLGLAHTTAPYVFPLDADDLAIAGTLADMADRLDAAPDAVACVADYQEFGTEHRLRGVPERLDPYRIAYINEYPVACLYRRSALERVGGWHEPLPECPGYEDWDLWMSFAEAGGEVVHLGPGRAGYWRRRHLPRLNAHARDNHVAIYRALRARHPRLFADIRVHRKASDLSPLRRLAYPVILGDRRLLRGELLLKAWLDRFGLWNARS